jgi:hypothetical protein
MQLDIQQTSYSISSLLIYIPDSAINIFQEQLQPLSEVGAVLITGNLISKRRRHNQP